MIGNDECSQPSAVEITPFFVTESFQVLFIMLLPTITCFLMVLHGSFSEEPVPTIESVNFFYNVPIQKCCYAIVCVLGMNHARYGYPSKSRQLRSGLSCTHHKGSTTTSLLEC